MSVSQNQTKPTGAAASANILHCFKSFYFLLLSLVLLSTFATVVWLQKQAADRVAVTAQLQQKAIVEFTQDTLVLQSLSQDLSKLVFDIKNAMQSLDKQQATFLDSEKFFLVNSVYQEASYTQSLVIKTFEMMAQLDAALNLANEHANQYQNVSPEYSAHLAHIQSIQSQADTLGRAFYKLSWKFDEVTTAITGTLQFARYNGFEAGANHFSSVGAQKAAAVDSSIFWVGSKLVDMKASISETMGLVDTALANAATPLAPGIFSKTNQWSLAALLSGFVAAVLLWFYGVIKPGMLLTASLESINQSNRTDELSVLANSTGEWGRIAQALKRIVKRQRTLVSQYTEKANELEQLKLSLLAHSYIVHDDPAHDGMAAENTLLENAVMVDTLSMQKSLPGFEQRPYCLN